MSIIVLETKINAPVSRVFDLARSIDLHKISTQNNNEEAIAGRRTGLINLGEMVTWRGRHFGWVHQLTSVITQMEGPFFFEDRMLKGPFKSLEHQHYFQPLRDQHHNWRECTLMKDVFTFSPPLGVLGKWADQLFLKNYMERFLMKRNAFIKQYAENEEKWMQVLNIY